MSVQLRFVFADMYWQSIPAVMQPLYVPNKKKSKNLTIEEHGIFDGGPHPV